MSQWRLGSGGAVWGQMLELTGRLRGRFTALPALQASWSDLHRLLAAPGSVSERLASLLHPASAPAPDGVESLLPDQVAVSAQGADVTRAVWLCALAEQAALDVYPVCFPGTMLVAVEDSGAGRQFLSVADGRALTSRHLQALLKGVMGNWARLLPEHQCRPLETVVLTRWLIELKAQLLAAGRFDEALVVVSEQLRLAPDDVFARRDRGYILDQLACSDLACADFEVFMRAYPQDPSTAALRERMRQLARQPMVRH